MNKFMLEAIRLSNQGMDHNKGGPFGAVIVKDGEIIGSGSNQVTSANDPTAHAEIMAIREACQKTKTYDLKGTTIFSSCEPCPMCLAAIYWANIDGIYYANTRKDAADIGFRDDFIYEELKKPVNQRSKPTIQLLRDQAIATFQKWTQKQDKTEY